LHLEAHGPEHAPVILTLHGGPGGDYRYLLGLADASAPGSLVRDHRVVFWDQRGTGLSRRHAESSLSMAQYFADLDALVDAVSPDRKVILLGHSWGGTYAAWYIAHHPERVLAAVLVDPQALTHALYVAHGPAADIDPFAEWVSDPLVARELISPDDHESADLLLTAAQLRTRLPRFANHADVPLFRAGCAVFKALDYRWFDDHDYDFTPGLAAFPGRVRILGGTADQVLGYAFQKRQVHLFAHADLLPLEGDGHNDPMFVDPERTIAEVRAFLDSVESETP
jgi:proline iminopeptidase